MVNKILIFFNIIVASGATLVVIYSHLFLKPPSTDQALEQEALKENAQKMTQIAPVNIKKFVVNLHSRGSRLRYLDLQMSILTFREDQKKMVEENDHIFKDVVIELASHLGPEEVGTMTGKILLQNKIKNKVNDLFGADPVVKQIFFSDFVVQ